MAWPTSAPSADRRATIRSIQVAFGQPDARGLPVDDPGDDGPIIGEQEVVEGRVTVETGDRHLPDRSARPPVGLGGRRGHGRRGGR